ncbi:hypothetical protein SteCoe_20340 [Stentor coeruleus]|uniref:Protein kinase domain-containing protein n=1 Tax=Stentor coeruleus TaxID=5963 RepID=A0A1R2BS80_9CILI|nr:hypothetical protein SteCoe_20340 [Stentor coeruleus]
MIAYFQKTYPSLYWEKQSESLVVREIIYKRKNRNFRVEMYSGDYSLNGDSFRCEIRKLKPRSDQNIYNFASSELYIIRSISDSSRFCECIGFYFEKINEESKVAYCLVTKSYTKQLISILNSQNLRKKEKLIKETIQGIIELHQREIFHGAIDPRSLYYDKTKKTVRIGNFLYSRSCNQFKEDFKNWKLLSSLLNKEFVAPEILLLQRCTRKGVSLLPFDPKKCDTFSIGLLILWIFNKTQGNLNLLKINEYECQNKCINKSIRDIYTLNVFKNRIFLSDLQQKIQEIEQAIKACIETFVENDERKKFWLLGALNVFYSERASCNELINLFENEVQILDVEAEAEDSDIMSCFDGNATESCIFDEIILEFTNIINRLFRLPVDWISVKDQIDAAIIRFSSDFKKAFDSHYDSPIEESIKVVDGIVIFVHSILFQLSDIENLKNFALNIVPKGQISYNFAMYRILGCRPDLRHYFVNGLSSLNFMKNDWTYFFFELPLKQDVIPLTEYPEVLKAFKKVFYSDILQNLFKKHFEISELIPLFEERVFPKIFLLKTQPSIHGMTSYDMIIYINCNVVTFTNSILWQGAVLVVLFHELAYFLTRINLKTRKAVRNSMTPRFEGFKLVFKENPNPVPEKNNRGEAGFRLEFQLFGERISRINAEAAEVFLNIDQYTNITEFRKTFYDKNQNDSDFISLARDTDEFTGVKCSFMN